jgi:alkylation response protein AidB-like acyl-CoA dehydrogenase
MLDIAVEHVGQRKQFGRPIGANQTPRHRLADAYVQLSAAHELVQIAWASDRPWDATVAKTYAGLAVDTTARACLQVCGAMGLTAEHALGGYVKRFRTLDALYGRWQRTMRAVGEQLLASRTIPRGVKV